MDDKLWDAFQEARKGREMVGHGVLFVIEAHGSDALDAPEPIIEAMRQYLEACELERKAREAWSAEALRVG